MTAKIQSHFNDKPYLITLLNSICARLSAEPSIMRRVKTNPMAMSLAENQTLLGKNKHAFVLFNDKLYQLTTGQYHSPIAFINKDIRPSVIDLFPGQDEEPLMISNDQLSLIYLATGQLFRPILNSDEKSAIVTKLAEDIEACAAGFSVRVNEIVNSLNAPQNLDDC